MAGGYQRRGCGGMVDRSDPGLDAQDGVVVLVVVALGCGAGTRAAGFHPYSPIHAASNRAPDSRAVAWMLGLAWTFVPPALVTPNTPVVSEIGVYAIAGVLMATTVAIVTGLCWLSWLKRGNVRTVILDAPD
jgi:hypothetical protein